MPTVRGHALETMNSASNAYFPPLTQFYQSGTVADDRFEAVEQGNQSLGASQVAAYAADRFAGMLRELFESATFLADPVLTHSFLGRGLPVVFTTEILAPAKEREQESTAECRRVLQRICRAVEEDSVEDGFNHLAEPILADLLAGHGPSACECLLNAFTDSDVSSRVRADLLRLLGRQKPEHVPSDCLVQIIRSSLASDAIEVRDGAAQAVESLKDPAALQLLSEHDETCGWLANYMSRVIRDLRGRGRGGSF